MYYNLVSKMTRKKELQQKMNTRQVVFVTVDVEVYPRKEDKEQALVHVTERIDNEMKRLGIDADVVVLPSIVKNIQFHETKRVK